jgi:ferredoxin-NADP reductase
MSGPTLSPSAPAAESTIDLDLVVRERVTVAEDVVVLTLMPPDGGPLPPWEPGAHVDLVLPDDLVRQYSLCGDPTDLHRWQVAILREAAGRGGSAWVHDHVGVGHTLRVRGPRNHFALIDALHYVFIAGGIGITPIIPMIGAVAAAGTPWSLLYGGRSATSMAFAEDLMSRYGAHVLLWPQDTRGLPDLDAALGRVGLSGDTAAVYCCGPEGLLRAVEDRCAALARGQLARGTLRAGRVGDPGDCGPIRGGDRVDR